MTANGYWVSFWGDEATWKLESGGCTTMENTKTH